MTRFTVVRHALGLDQSWHLLAMDTPEAARSYEFGGRLADGAAVRIGERGASDAGERWPIVIARLLGRERWRRYLARQPLPPVTGERNSFGQWLCEAWNGQPRGERLWSFSVRVAAGLTGADREPVGSDSLAPVLLEGSCVEH